MISSVRLFGGLGNQMFQYAFGRRLANVSGCEIAFDVENGFRHDFFGRKFALDEFQANIAKISSSDVPFGMGWNGPLYRLANAGWKVLPRNRQRVVHERVPFQCDPTVLLNSGSVGKYYFGYWQNEAYFAPIQDMIRKEFTLRIPLRPPLIAMMNEISGCRSVSMHVRRNHGIGQQGKPHKQAKEFHGSCDADFFQRAIAEIGITTETVCYIFTDNLAWVKQNLKLPTACRYVADLGPWSDAEEMILMAACQHHIISNSTFSWWGAWLGQNPSKVVIAPKIWMAGLPVDRTNIYPAGWRRL